MRVTDTTTAVLGAVLAERERQFQKFGDDNPLAVGTDQDKLACLAEEFGEASREVCEGSLFGHDTDDDLYKELVQVAAVATAFAERVRSRRQT